MAENNNKCKKSLRSPAKRALNRAHTEVNRQRKRRKHMAKHPNDDNVPKKQRQPLVKCYICGTTLHSTKAVHRLLPATKDLREKAVSLCHYHDTHIDPVPPLHAGTGMLGHFPMSVLRGMKVKHAKINGKKTRVVVFN